MLFFERTIGCRRRMRRKWEETPIAKVFTLPSEFHLLQQRAQSCRVREAIKRKGLMLYDAFRAFDHNKNGLLSADELYGALEWLGIHNLTPADILDFIRTVDVDRDGNLHYREFLELIRDPDSKPEDLDKESEGSSQVEVVNSKRSDIEEIKPKGEKELLALREELALEEKKMEEEEKKKERDEEDRYKSEIEAEEEKKNREQVGGPNPKVDTDRIIYDFTTGSRPLKLGTRGDIAYKPLGAAHYLKVYKKAALILPIPFSKNGGGNYLNQYSVTLEIKCDDLPIDSQPLMQCTKFTPDDGEITISRDGGVGSLGTFGLENKGLMVKKDKWCIVTITVDTLANECRTYMNGRPLAKISSSKIIKDGAFSLKDQFGLFIGKNASEVDMNIKLAMLDAKVLSPSNVQQLFDAFRSERQWKCAACTCFNPEEAVRCQVCGKQVRRKRRRKRKGKDERGAAKLTIQAN